MALYMLLSNHYSLDKLQAVFTADDNLLLLGDGVYQLPLLSAYKELYVRKSDIEQRGLNATDFDNLKCINDSQWVELTLNHGPVVSLK